MESEGSSSIVAKMLKAMGLDRARRMPELDGLRAIAVLMVLLYHTWSVSLLTGPTKLIAFNQDWTFVLALGHPGVDLFYVLSGFLLFLPFARSHYSDQPRPSLRTYYWRRLLRILPAYYLVLFVVVAVINPSYYLSGANIPNVIINILFMQNLFGFGTAYPAIVAVAWTLAIEMQFYLILPLMARFFVGNKWKISFPLVVLGVTGYRVLVFLLANPNTGAIDWNFYYSSEYNLLGVLDNFAIGMVVANYYQYYKQNGHSHLGEMISRMTRKAVWAAPVMILFALYIYYNWRYSTDVVFAWFYFSFLFDITVYLSFTLILVFVLFNESKLRSFLSYGALGFIGIIGYSVYLWHLPTLQYLATTGPLLGLTGWNQFMVLLPIGLVVVFSLSFVTFVLISHSGRKKDRPRNE
jgi:peptidoglycan/LPS O-acetylase OafA/YrhL